MNREVSWHRTLSLLGPIIVGALVMSQFIVGCAGSGDVSTLQTTTSTTSPTMLELAVGSYSGEYGFVSPARDDICGLTLVVGADGSLVVMAETVDGATLELTGRVSVDGTVTASAPAASGDGEVVMTGSVVVRAGVASLEGSWENRRTKSLESGTWLASRR